MKTGLRLLLVTLAFLISFHRAAAQGTAFTYQGRLNDGAGPASGLYDVRFMIYDSTNSPGTVIAGPLTLTAASVSNGLFTTTLDFGPGVFTGPARWLELAVRTNGAGAFTTLEPRQQLTASTYAIFAGGVNAAGISGAIPAANLTGTYSSTVNFNNGANSFSGTFYGQFLGVSFIGGSFSGAFIGDGSGLINLNASQLSSGTVPDARLAPNIARTNQVWLLNGNAGTAAGTHFVGTTDNQPLELKVANDRVFRFEPAAEVPNLIGGSRSNFVSAGIQGATIAGGGLPLYPNFISADYGAIGGGTFNGVTGPWGTVAGGRDNRAYSESATVGGGFRNGIESNSWYSTVAGGAYNLIASNSFDATIGGGSGNVISNNAGQSTIAGGYGNQIHFNNSGATIGGGQDNRITNNSYLSVIAGGYQNRVYSDSFTTTIGGGEFNHASSGDSTVAGGGGNRALATAATVGGGNGNRVESPWSVIAGGRDNVISSNSSYTTISGGISNEVAAQGIGSTISGGNNNEIGFNSFYGVIGGGGDNLIQRASFYSTIAGGQRNLIGTNSFHTIISGGWSNYANGSFLVIGGGTHNTNIGQWGTIPGGFSNFVAGSYSFAAGRQARAIHNGTFVWADSTAAVFPSAAGNEFAVRASGGVRFVTSGAGLTVDGQPVVAGTVGSSQLSGTYGNALTFDNPANSFTGDGSGLSNVNAAALGGLTADGFWQLGGNNAGLNHFLGTTNNVPLELRANNVRGLYLETDGAGTGAHVIGGSRSNRVAFGGIFSSTISGGGGDAAPNLVSDDYAAIGGGLGNIAGNTNGSFDVSAPTVGGGYNNMASGSFATVPGGVLNLASGSSSFAAGNRAKATHPGAFVWGDSTTADITSTNSDSVTMRAGGGYRLFSNTGATAGVFLASGSGTWTSMSDRNAKENFRPVDGLQVLERIARMPIQTWNYKSQDPSIRHVGPMAQDFNAAFGLGETDTGITTVDADGVALAAIQGLNQKLEEKEAAIHTLKEQNDLLAKRLDELTAIVQSLAEKK